MSKKLVPTFRQYQASQPGYGLTLPDGMFLKDSLNRKRSLVKFPSITGGIKQGLEGEESVASGGIFKTDDPEIQKFIENSTAFKQGIITRVPTAEEIAIRKKEEAIDAKITHYKDMLNQGLKIDFSTVNDSNLREIAKGIGVETSDEDGKKLSTKVIADKIKEVLGIE